MQTLRVNKNASVDIKKLSTGESVAVVDDFLVNPDELREYAARHARDFVVPPRSYPGVVMAPDPAPFSEIYRFIRTPLRGHFDYLRGGARFQTLLSMTTLQPGQLSNLQRLCHTDPPAARNRLNYAFVLYLFENDRLGGTGFYRWKEKDAITEATALEKDDPVKALDFLQQRFPTYREPPRYITETNEIAERLDVVAAKFNRLVFYSGDIPHSAQIASPELLTDDFGTGRLTLNCFASLRPKPG